MTFSGECIMIHARPNWFKDLFIGPQEFVVGYSKAPEQRYRNVWANLSLSVSVFFYYHHLQAFRSANKLKHHPTLCRLRWYKRRQSSCRKLHGHVGDFSSTTVHCTWCRSRAQVTIERNSLWSTGECRSRGTHWNTQRNKTRWIQNVPIIRLQITKSGRK